MEKRYEYETSPRKVSPSKKKIPSKKRKEENEQLKRNKEQREKALKLEKKQNLKNVGFIVAIFFILLLISYRSSLINEKFNELQTTKNKLAAIEKTNGQLQVSIESSLNLANIEEVAREKLGMKRLENSQKVYITLDKKDYIEIPEEEVKEEKEDKWYNKILNFLGI